MNVPADEPVTNEYGAEPSDPGPGPLAQLNRVRNLAHIRGIRVFATQRLLVLGVGVSTFLFFPVYKLTITIPQLHDVCSPGSWA